MRRLTIATAAVALTIAAALTGCTTEGPAASPTATSKASTAASTPAPSTTETAVADPKAAEPTSNSTPTTPAATAPSASAFAQHIYDECSTGAATAGVHLTFTADPFGYMTPGLRYQVTYPFTFLDGHTDPYAIYNCTLTDNTITSTYVSGGLSDSR